MADISRDKALKMLMGGRRGISKWNRLRHEPFSSSDPRRAALALAIHGGLLKYAKLHGADLRRANLTSAILDHSDLSMANLSETDLALSSLNSVNLRGANLSGADLRSARLVRADLTDANLQGAYVGGADLSGANLSGADLRVQSMPNAKLIGASLEGARVTREEDTSSHASFLDLATADGLDRLDSSSTSFILEYVSRVIDYISREGILELELHDDFFGGHMKRIRALRHLTKFSEEPNDPLIRAVNEISAQLIRYLQKHPKALYSVHPRQFEEIIAEVLASYGWDIELTPTTRDGGYDIFAISKDVSGLRTSWMIECKRYSPENKVGVDIVRQLYGSRVFHPRSPGNLLVATTSHFTKGVKEMKASKYDLELRDFEGIVEWINDYRAGPDGQLHVKDNKIVVPGREKD